MVTLPTYTPTGAWGIQNKLGQEDETAYGDAVTNPAFDFYGHNALMAETNEIVAQKYRELGNRDIYTMLKTGRLHSFELRHSPNTTTMWRWGTELPGGAGTPGVSKTFAYTQLIDAVANYFWWLGCIPDRTELEITEAGITMVQNILAKDHPEPVTSNPFSGTPSWPSPDTNPPGTNLSSGVNPLTINGVNYDISRLKITVNWSPYVLRPNGWETAKYIFVTNRDIDVELDAYKSNSVLRGDLRTLTARAASYVMLSGKTISLTDLTLQRMTVPNDSQANSPKIETFVGSAEAITTTA